MLDGLCQPTLSRIPGTKKGSHNKLTPFDFLAGPMGLEPLPSGVTGRRYNQLNYDPKKSFFKFFNSSLMVGGTGLEPVTSTV